MKAFFDSIARGFEAMGVHPVLGALIIGAVIVFIFTRRSSGDAKDLVAHKLPAASSPLGVSFKTDLSHTENVSLTVDGRTVECPPEVMTQIRAGNKVAAIKVLRAAAGVDLTTAKQMVDKLAASPLAR